MKKNTTYNFQQTQKIGENLAKQILKQNLGNIATVLGLQGELGAGKTTFLQGFAKGLGIKEKVLSPTFIIMKKFEIRNPKFETNSKLKIRNKKVPQNRRPSILWYKYFYHIDCYRLKDEKDLAVLGIREIMLNPENIVAIEWPEKVTSMLPKHRNSIKFSYINKTTREIIFA